MTTDAREPELEELQPHAVTSGENAEANSRFDYGIMAPTRTFEHFLRNLVSIRIYAYYVQIWLEESE